MVEAFGWRSLAVADDAFASTALFEELGWLCPSARDALDVVSVAFLPVPVPASVIWPVGR